MADKTAAERLAEARSMVAEENRWLAEYPTVEELRLASGRRVIGLLIDLIEAQEQRIAKLEQRTAYRGMLSTLDSVEE